MPDTFASRATLTMFAGCAMMLVSACDSNESDDCPVLRTDSYTQSVTGVDPPTAEIVALFEMQQDVDSYSEDSCTAPESGVSRTRIVVRNLTSCDLSFTYTLSASVGQTGTTVSGSVSVGRDALADQGVVFRDSGIRLDQAQITLNLSGVARSGCG